MKKIIITIVLILALSSCFGNKQEENKQETNTNTKQLEESNRVRNNMDEISKKVVSGELTEQEATQKMMDSVNDSTMSMVEKQKIQMPKVLKVLKVNLTCIKEGNGKDDFEKCYEEGKKLSKQLGIENMYDEGVDSNENFDWSTQKKQEVITEIEESIKELETSIPCVEKAVNLEDLMKCYPNT